MVHIAISVLYNGLGEIDICVMMGFLLIILVEVELVSLPPLGSDTMASQSRSWVGLIKELFKSRVCPVPSVCPVVLLNHV